MSYVGNQPTSAAFVTDQYNGTGSQTAFTMSVAPANTASILVNISGVTQDPTTYSVNGLTLTFSSAPPTGTGNISVRYLGIPATGIVNTAYSTRTEFTATAGQTSFTVPSYTVGFIQVYRNGVLLGTADYTATTGTTVVLATGATSGDLVTTISFYVSSVLGAIPASAGAVTTPYILDGAVTQAKLGTNVAGNGPAFSAYLSSNQSVSSGVNTKVAFDTEEFDTNNNFASSRFTPTVAGYYQINSTVYMAGSANTQGIVAIFIYKNGSSYKQGTVFYNATTAGTSFGTNVSSVVYCNGTTDYIEIYGQLTQTSPIFSGGITQTYVNGFLARAA